MSQACNHPILVVDDDHDVADTVCEILVAAGFFVVTAYNGREALDRVHEIRRPCVIFLDLMMPVMNGCEFLAILRQSETAIPVVVVSAWAHEAAELSEQTQGFLQKPVSLRSLLDVAHRFCESIGGVLETARS